MLAAYRVGNGERDWLVETVEDDEQGGVGTAAAEAGRLASAIDQHAETAVGLPVFPLHFFAGGVNPGDVLDAQLLVVDAGEEAVAAKDGVLVANFG